jgi:hypothetical protein
MSVSAFLYAISTRNNNFLFGKLCSNLVVQRNLFVSFFSKRCLGMNENCNGSSVLIEVP